jgi:hypothetical protein
MTRFKSHVPSAALVVAVIALVWATAGSAIAGETAHLAAVISGKQIKRNSITTRQIKNGSLLRRDFKLGHVPMWAVVRETGQVVRGFGVAGISLNEAGGNKQYQVRFKRNVSRCSYQATVGNPAGIDQGQFSKPGLVTVARLNGAPDVVAVSTFNADGTQLVRSSFHLAVVC